MTWRERQLLRSLVSYDKSRFVTRTKKVAHLLECEPLHLDHGFEFDRARPGFESLKDILDEAAVALISLDLALGLQSLFKRPHPESGNCKTDRNPMGPRFDGAQPLG